MVRNLALSKPPIPTNGVAHRAYAGALCLQWVSFDTSTESARASTWTCSRHSVEVTRAATHTGVFGIIPESRSAGFLIQSGELDVWHV